MLPSPNEPPSEPSPPANPALTGTRLARTAVSLGLAFVIGLVAFLGLYVAGKLYPVLRPVDHSGLRLGVSTVLASVTGIVAARRIRSVRSLLWLVFPIALVPAGIVAIVYVSIALYVEVGSNVSECAWPGTRLDECIGHDWSFMQGRHEYTRASGAFERSVCRSFEAAVPAVPTTARTDDGSVRCPLGSPRVWRSWPCEDLGQPPGMRCYICSGQSDTVDSYFHSVAFDASCEHAIISYGVNVHPRDIDRCERSYRMEDCPNSDVSIHDPADDTP